MRNKEIQALAARHNLQLIDQMQFNEMGLDFKVGFATDTSGQQWLLRVPRRSDMGPQIASEKAILELVGKYLNVQVPHWQIATPELVAYPLLQGQPALTFDAQTYAVSWNMDKDSLHYIPSLAQALVQLHDIPAEEVKNKGIKVLEPEDLRAEIAERLQLVKSELGIGKELYKRYQAWLDNDPLWPDFSKFIHGDLYAGHVLTLPDGTVSGIIDWTTAHMSDIALDFAGHLNIFGEESLKNLITEYQKQGGEVWDHLFEQSAERAAAAPLAYGYFALETQDEQHLKGAKAQLQ